MLLVMHQTARDNRTVKRPSRTKAEWVEEVARWRASGQSARAYASVRGLNPGTLAVWASRLGPVVGVDEPAGETGKVRFLPVRVAPSPSARATSGRGEIEVILVNGRRVRISGEFDAEVVAKLLEIAERGGRC
jgi:hypothetical protein